MKSIADNRRARMRVVALATYPPEGASTRFRVVQFVNALREHGVDVDVRPFLTPAGFRRLYDRRWIAYTALMLLWSCVRRLAQLPSLCRADVVFVQREAGLIGPPFVEWFLTRVARVPMVLDLDDPTYLDQVSPVYGRVARWLKWPGKTLWLIDHASMVICGNEHVADFVRGRGGRAVVMQTIVDTATFRERDPRPDGGDPVVGWIGSHSTYPYFESIIPVLESLAKRHRFRVRLVGSGREEVVIRGVEVELVPWDLAREVSDFHSIDIGVYPLPSDKWAEGKSGLKAIEYLSVGIPWVGSPVGVLSSIGESGTTHLTACTPDQWEAALSKLLADANLRARMGRAGRQFATTHYSINEFAGRLAAIFEETQSKDAHPA